jgi:hypothetical protein
VLLFAAALLFAPGNEAAAGAEEQSAYCYKFANGAGYCRGTMLGFRNHYFPFDPYTSIEFRRFREEMYCDGGTDCYGGDSRSMYARYNGASFSCVPNSYVSAVWDELVMLNSGYFHIQWDSLGSCTSVTIRKSSKYENF